MKTIFYEYSTTNGKKYGVWSTGKGTGDVKTEEIFNEDELEEIKIGEQEIKDGKKVLWEYENIIPNIEKLKKPIDLNKLYYQQFEEII